jgi:hypothetical protein
VSAECVALIPQCAKCGKAWLAADERLGGETEITPERALAIKSRAGSSGNDRNGRVAMNEGVDG